MFGLLTCRLLFHRARGRRRAHARSGDCLHAFALPGQFSGFFRGHSGFRDGKLLQHAILEGSRFHCRIHFRHRKHIKRDF